MSDTTHPQYYNRWGIQRTKCFRTLCIRNIPKTLTFDWHARICDVLLLYLWHLLKIWFTFDNRYLYCQKNMWGFKYGVNRRRRAEEALITGGKDWHSFISISARYQKRPNTAGALSEQYMNNSASHYYIYISPPAARHKQSVKGSKCPHKTA